MGTYTQKAPSAGGNYLEIFALASTTEVGASTAPTGHVFQRIESSSPSGYHTKNNFMLDWVNKEDQQTLDAHLNLLLVKDPINEIEQSYEDGPNETYKKAAKTTYEFAFVYYAGDINAERAVHYGLGVYTGDTGNRAYAADTLGGTTVQVSATQAAVTITFPSTILNTYLVTAIGDLTLNPESGSAVTYFTALNLVKP